MIDLKDNPLVLPEGHRIVYRYFRRPVRIAGELRQRETVRVIQRLDRCYRYPLTRREWVDIGFYDEVFPSLAKVPLHPADWSTEP